MEFTFYQLKQKDVINLSDGRNLGKVCDATFLFPENDMLGITVTGSRGFRFNRQEMFIPMRQVVKIGDDAVLVKVDECGKRPPKPNADCPPPNNCPPTNNCPPPNNCPPNNFPPNNCRPDRRSYDEYE